MTTLCTNFKVNRLTFISKSAPVSQAEALNTSICEMSTITGAKTGCLVGAVGHNYIGMSEVDNDPAVQVDFF